MKIEAIKNVNITALFASPSNPLLVSQEGLLDLFKTDDEAKDKMVFIEAPGLKVLILPNRKKEFVFESIRILVNDKSEILPENSEVIDDFEKIIKSDMVEKDKIVAYGFNYDAVIMPENSNFKNSDLVGSKIADIQGIKSVGVSIVFEKNNTAYTFEIKPIGSEQKFIAHFNAHFSINKLPDIKELKGKINKEFLEFKNTIEKI